MASLIILISLDGHAGEPAFAPSDLDLHVAYCLGADEAVFIRQSAEIASKNALLSDTYKRNAQATQQRLDLLNNYLDRRLPLLRQADMDAASKQGFSDQKFTFTDSQIQSCFRQCSQPLLHRLDLPIDRRKTLWLRCSADCNENMPKLMTCSDLSWLQ